MEGGGEYDGRVEGELGGSVYVLVLAIDGELGGSAYVLVLAIDGGCVGGLSAGGDRGTSSVP